MTIWLTADEHYDHDQIRIYENRPFDTLRVMNRTLIANHNSMVKEEDTVYHLGDFSMSKEKRRVESTLKNLKGKHYLILGNHDYLHPFEYEDIGFIIISTALDIGELILVHDPAKSREMQHRLWACGHVHGLFLVQANVVNVGVDVWGYKPVEMEKALKLVVTAAKIKELDKKDNKGVGQTVAAKAPS